LDERVLTFFTAANHKHIKQFHDGCFILKG
jgi:hypothetical protein